MKTLHIVLIFVLVAIAQWFVPMNMIFHQESIINTGTLYKFKTRPIDPSDPFRGKYIVLNYDINNFKTNDSTLADNEKLYLYIKNDSLGFAAVDSISDKILNTNSDYIVLDNFWYYHWNKELSFNLPFNRFYMEESKAKPAEYAYRAAQRDSLPNNMYAEVYVKDGEAVLEDVIVNSVSISKFVEE